jgi:hypothetical protein
MISSQPIERAIAALASVETVPITRKPSNLAICTASSPTPPAAAWSRIVSPALICGLVLVSQ